MVPDPDISPPQRWPYFIGLLAQEVSQASDTHPTVKVWKDTELVALIRQVIRRHKAQFKSSLPTGAAILQRLESSHWLRPIPVTENQTGRVFYLMDHEAPKQFHIPPEEILLATLPSGVISYFSALQFYELTTQPLTFAHIGRLAKGHPPEPPENAAAQPLDKNTLGTPLFHLDGLPCFETKRYVGLTPGVNLRIQDNRTWYRVTTLEQTLLDTLLQPLRCGGEAVIFEAWENAWERIDWERLTNYLSIIERPSLIRRTATLLDMMKIRIPSHCSLQSLLDQTQQQMGAAPLIPLLPGLMYRTQHPRWRVTTP